MRLQADGKIYNFVVHATLELGLSDTKGIIKHDSNIIKYCSYCSLKVVKIRKFLFVHKIKNNAKIQKNTHIVFQRFPDRL